MTRSATRHFFVSQQLIPGLINGLINGAIAGSMHGAESRLGLWDQGAYAHDLLATGLLLPAITWWILRPLLRSQSAKGKAPDLQGVPNPRLLRWMHAGVWSGALAIGLMGMLLVGGGSTLVLHLLGAPDFSGTDYVYLKGGFALLLTFCLQPTMVFAALRTSAQATQAARI